MIQNKALFLDRDGVINKDKGYVYRKEDIEFIEGIFALVSRAVSKNYKIIVVTNQAGIGRGYYKEKDFFRLMDWMSEKFLENGGRIDKVYYCPFHPEKGIYHFKQDSKRRKPNPGMLIDAQNDFNINISQSIMIGDKISDMQAAAAAGVGKKFLLGDLIYEDSVSIKNLSEVILV